MMLKRTAICGALLALLGSAAARADLVINVGNIRLQPNMDNQQVLIYVTTSTAQSVQAVQLQVQIGNGGTAYGDAGPEPSIDSLDLLGNSNAIFFPDNNGQSPSDPSTGVIGVSGQIAARSTITSPTGAPSVLANGLLATLKISTLGCYTPEQSWPLSLTSTSSITMLDGDTAFGELIPTIINGSITIAPEPASALLLGAGAALLLRRRRRLPTASA